MKGAILERPPRPMPLDPPVRADKRCVVCGERRKINKQTRRYAGNAADVDPFCSGKCCRSYYANPLPERSIWENDYGVGKVSA